MIDIKKKAKNTRTIAICSLIFGLFSVIPFYIGTLFNIISWILYMIVLYRLKTHAGAKNLFKNYFITLFILLSCFILSYLLFIFFTYYSFNYSDKPYFLLISFIAVLLIVYVLFCLIYFKFFKRILYEIARVTNQPYFIKAYKMYFYGFLTLPILIGVIFIIIGCVYNFLAWYNFKEFNESEFIENQD